jgi:23S rRNA pseudouridine1911/1915/1917 synthase
MLYTKVDSKNYIGSRIDTVLLSLLQSYYKEKAEEQLYALSRDFVKSIVLDVVQVNGIVRKPSYKVREGDNIEVNYEEAESRVQQKIIVADNLNKIIPELGELEIVYEDKDLAVVNKAKGMVVHPAHGNSSGTLANYFRGYLESKGEYDVKLERGGIVHRLDKGVSGLMVLAKTRKSQLALKKQFEEHTVLKIYYAKCMKINDNDLINKIKVVNSGSLEGILKRLKSKYEEGEGIDLEDFTIIDGWIGRSNINRFQMEYVEEIIPSQGTFKSCRSGIVRLNEDEFTIVIRTGRMHQIRATLRYYGFVIEGDELYSSGNPTGSNQIALESKFIGFKNLEGEVITVSRKII